MSEIIASWIYDRSSLTQRLRDLCPQKFSVVVLYQGWQRPRHDERRVLDLPAPQRAWVREVHLCCEGKPLVFARTVIPHTTLTGPRKRLMRLGRRPLGALLFAARRVRRRHFGVISLAGDSELLANGGTFPRTTIWGRRAVFYLQDKPLLVSEFFLPSLWRHA
jgi:chorismate--pyruvate lyase